MLELNDKKDILKGVVIFSDCEKELGVKWLSGSSQAAFYIGNKKMNKDDVNDFISGEQICCINLKSYLSYLKVIRKIISKYGSMYNGPLDKIEDIYYKFSKIKESDANIVLSYKYPDRYIRILNNKNAQNVKKYGDLILKNGDDFRHSYLGGITLITIKKINNKYELFVEILNNWRDELMEINSNRLDLDAIVKIFNDEIESNLKNGKTVEMSAEIFGIKYCPLLNKYNNKFTYKDIVANSNYNIQSVVEFVKNGMDISSSVLWDKTIDDEENFNVYGIHMTLKNSALDKENPHICIGWSGLGDLSSINTKDNLKDFYISKYPDASKNTVGQNVTQIWQFINEAKIGDYVVYFDRPIAHIGRIIGEYEYLKTVSNQDNDYVNNRKVEWIKDILYSDLSSDFRDSSKTMKSFFRLPSYKSLIEDILNEKDIKNICEESEEVNDKVSPFDFNGSTIKDGKNLIVYGTPGCGKSYYVKNVLLDGYPKENRIRTTFFADYTNTDFVGQILPVVEGEKVTYKFNPGPFTLALAQAIRKPNEKVAIVIEELNRGSAPSIFGDIFQLLDRKNGVSEYSITNINVIDYLNKEFEDQYHFNEIRIPSNLFIYATMNTSDQNVFTLDTAFKRRWEFKKLSNEFNEGPGFKDDYIPGADVTWKQLVTGINNYMLSLTDSYNNEDKQIGIYFVAGTGMRKDKVDTSSIEERERFAYKVLEYLWDDVSKFDRKSWFDENIKSLDELVKKYIEKGIEVFNGNLKDKIKK